MWREYVCRLLSKRDVFYPKIHFFKDHQHLFERHYILIYNIDIYNTIPSPATFFMKVFIVVLKE